MSFEFKGDFSGMLEKLKAGVRGAASDAVEASLLEGEAEAKRECPVNEGELRASITHQKADSDDAIVGQIGTPLAYAAAVEFGTKPHFPPLEAIQRWVHLKGLAASESEEKSIAFAIARKIAARGTVGKFYLTKGYMKMKTAAPRFVKTFMSRIRTA
jgi:hypothetical protein